MTVARRTVPAAVLLAVVATGPVALADPAPVAPAAGPAVAVTVDAAQFARSEVLAGYRARLDGGVRHRVTAAVTVPTVDCSARPPDALAAEIVLSGTPLTDHGTGAVFVIVSAHCVKAKPTYDALGFTASGGTGIGIGRPVTPGSVLTLVASSTAAGSTFRLTAADGTVVLSGTGGAFAVQWAQVTTQGGGGNGFPRPAAPVSFSAVRVDGAPIAAAGPQRLTQVDATGRVLARPTALGSTGDAFAIRFPPPV